MSDVRLRSAHLDDVAELIDFWLRAGENDARPTDSPGAVETLIRRDPDALIIAERDGRIVGTVIAGWDGWRSHLYRLAVDPSQRRQGIGRRLLARAESRLSELGTGRIDAMVLEGNDLGQAIWRDMKYQRQAEWARWVKPTSRAGRGTAADPSAAPVDS